MYSVTFVDSLEERFAKVLDEVNIGWMYEVRYTTKAGNNRFRTVDFVLSRPVNIVEMPEYIEKIVFGPRKSITHIEIKHRMIFSHGRVNRHALKQQRDLAMVGIHTLILPEIAIQWIEDHGLERGN